MAVETKYCIVCGQGSSRPDWQGKDVVACDQHSKDEVAKAVAAKKKGNGPVLVPGKPTAPPASTPTTAPAGTSSEPTPDPNANAQTSK